MDSKEQINLSLVGKFGSLDAPPNEKGEIMKEAHLKFMCMWENYRFLYNEMFKALHLYAA